MRITGIEPISSAWKADNLPLIYIRMGGKIKTSQQQEKKGCSAVQKRRAVLLFREEVLFKKDVLLFCNSEKNHNFLFLNSQFLTTKHN